MEISNWHRAAELFLEEKLTLPEIGKQMIINEAMGFVERTEGAKRIGINVIDNSDLHDSLVFGLLQRHRQDVPIAYSDLATLLGISPRIVSASMNRLLNKYEAISKEDRGRLGAVYTVHPKNFYTLPTWIVEFTGALIELHDDAELKALVAADVKDTRFYQGFEHLKMELREKFYRPRNDTDAPGLAPLDLA